LILVDPEAKTLNPPPGEPRNTSKGPWRLAKKDGKAFIDLMWSCGRTSWADGDLESAGGCHSPIRSQLPKNLHFKNQKQIYDVVTSWQKPVKDGLAQVQAMLKTAQPALSTSKAPQAKLAQAALMVNQAEQIVDALKRDGSWGVHAPGHSLKKINEAKLLSQGAIAIATGKEGKAKLSMK